MARVGEVSVKFKGNWRALQNKMNKLSEQTRKVVRKSVDDSAEDMHQTMLDAIMNQNYPFAPLADYTIEKKGHDKVFFETGQVFEGLEVKRLVDEDDLYRVFIGAPHHIMHESPERDDMPLSELVELVQDEGGRYERLLFKTTVDRRQESVLKNVDKALSRLI